MKSKKAAWKQRSRIIHNRESLNSRTMFTFTQQQHMDNLITFVVRSAYKLCFSFLSTKQCLGATNDLDENVCFDVSLLRTKRKCLFKWKILWENCFSRKKTYATSGQPAGRLQTGLPFSQHSILIHPITYSLSLSFFFPNFFSLVQSSVHSKNHPPSISKELASHKISR